MEIRGRGVTIVRYVTGGILGSARTSLATSPHDVRLMTMIEVESILTSSRLGRAYTVWSVRGTESTSAGLCLFLDGEFYRQRMATVDIVNRLIAEKKIPPVNLIFVSHIDSDARHRDYICNPDYTAFLAEELLPWVAKSGLSTSSDVLLAGLSLSGLAAAYAGVEYPHLFTRVLCQSPSAWWSNEWLTSHVMRRSHISSSFWISVGSEENDDNVRHSPTLEQKVSQRISCQALANSLTQCSARTLFHEYPGGHTLLDWEQDLPQALGWLYSDRVDQSQES
ncbi:MAG: alpha/beta hydrolase-fold protein [Planctomycetaceae bacterium]